MSRAPVALWWLLLLVAAGVAIVPVGSVEHRAESTAEELAQARGWEGTTQLVEGRFVRMSRVQEVLPRSYSARSTYEVEVSGASSPVEVDVPARSDSGPPQESEQPDRLDLRIARDDRGRAEAVEWGESLASLDVEIARRADAASAAGDRATLTRWTVGLVLGVLLLGCVLATVVASREPGGLGRRFAGTRAAADADPDRLERAARSPELPIGMLVLTLFALVVPLGWPDRGTAVLSGFVALAAVALLVREQEAVARVTTSGAPASTARRRVALVWRGSAVVGVLLGLLLLFLGWFSSGLAPDAAEGGEMLRRGLAVLVLSGCTVAAAFHHRAGPVPTR
ncbi:hypothetical protein [Aeromicrobium sp. Leaf272]|uniref:hypothetical protein n=1 Tax=Aeromicrobium sp. Leaf272 TaxID=1736317 RepID=UPI0006F861CC|nr:hypothetical protein [Aeromicrobium sp. Leaf272]KQP27631.1 hypothetical protein ASF38_01810 [Aeromicrobium sp. Leaf272]